MMQTSNLQADNLITNKSAAILEASGKITVIKFLFLQI
jgi:hypothetical protein